MANSPINSYSAPLNPGPYPPGFNTGMQPMTPDMPPPGPFDAILKALQSPAFGAGGPGMWAPGLGAHPQVLGQQPAAPAAPVDTSMLSQILQGLAPQGANAGNQFSTPGIAPPSTELPPVPRLPGENFGPALETLAGAKPAETALQMAPRQYPGAMTPEEQDKLISEGKWSGVAQGAMSAPEDAGVGDILFRAGLGGLQGKAAAKAQLRKDEGLREEKQFEFNTRREEANLDRQDKLTHDKMAYALSLAGLQGEQAKSVANTATEQAKLDYNNELEKVKLSIDAAKELQPKIISLGRGVAAIQTRDAQGGVHITTTPLVGQEELGGLKGGALGTAGDVQDWRDLQASGGNPIVGARMVIHHLDRMGMLPKVFGDSLNQAETAASKATPPDLRTMGAQGEAEALRRQKAQRDLELSMGLINSPNLMKRAFELLKKPVGAE